jgi:CARDB protein
MSCSGTACVVVAGLIGGIASGGAAGLPDLVETSVTVSQHGRTLVVRDTVGNRGGATASASWTAYFVGAKRIASRPVRSLFPGAASQVSRRLTIPAAVPPGSWRFRACADARARVRESNERNNCRVASRLVVVGDITPPWFEGLARATTCVPGPVGGTTRYTPYQLEWKPAVDDGTVAGELVYHVYEAQTAGGEDFSEPSYTTQPGATSFSTPPLPDNVSHFFVVRAIDRAGNEDANDFERAGENLCL